MPRYDISLLEYVDKQGIPYNSKGYTDCVFCGAKKKLKLNFAKNLWVCPHCGGGGVLHFHARYMMGYDQLPSNEEEKSKISESLNEFMGTTDYKPTNSATRKPAERIGPKRPVAKDAKLHAVYAAMAGLAIFQLTPEHQKKLKSRGLTSAQIERNGYRTFPYKIRYIPPEIVQRYNAVDAEIRAKVPSEKKARQIQFGMHIAQLLQERGCSLDGVPGFYKFGENWCLLFSPGIMIPTRNVFGQIVIWQIRRDFNPKYITLSCQDNPGAVDDEVSRCHFPISNDKPSPLTKVIFTEGPLKADVAKALSSDPCMFIAIHGVKNYKDLFKNCEMLHQKYGISKFYNALDMDRLTNPNVRDGSQFICDSLAKMGLEVVPMYWGERYASEQLMYYQAIARARNIPIPPHDSRLPVYEKLNLTTLALHKAKIELREINREFQFWEDETKGIDDYLYSQIQKKEHTHRAKTNYIRSYQQTLLRINSETTP